MCTVSLIRKSDNTLVLTSNRDEHVLRETLPLAMETIGRERAFYPKDRNAGGTWISATESGRFCCLLNGAFTKHDRKESYRKSRGLILLEAFTYTDFKAFTEEIDLDEIEPFTLLSIEVKDAVVVSELRWDGHKKHFKRRDENEPHIWASATLYPKNIREEREKWFEDFLNNDPSPSEKNILQFHATTHGNKLENDIVMRRGNGLQTVSITQLVIDMSSFSMRYKDLVKNEEQVILKEIKNTFQHA